MADGGSSPDEIARDELFDLALRALDLKDLRRTGWLLKRVDDPESVADHSWGTALLCLLFARLARVDPGQAVGMALVHDLAEVQVGDIPWRADDSDRTVSVAEKSRLEHEAIDELLPASGSHLRWLWLRYEEGEGEAAMFVRDMNLIDMCLQALHYLERGRFSASVEPDGSPPLRAAEFLASARARVATPVGKALLARVEQRYDELIDQRSGPLS